MKTGNFLLKKWLFTITVIFLITTAHGEDPIYFLSVGYKNISNGSISKDSCILKFSETKIEIFVKLQSQDPLKTSNSFSTAYNQFIFVGNVKYSLKSKQIQFVYNDLFQVKKQGWALMESRFYPDWKRSLFLTILLDQTYEFQLVQLHRGTFKCLLKRFAKTKKDLLKI